MRLAAHSTPCRGAVFRPKIDSLHKAVEESGATHEGESVGIRIGLLRVWATHENAEGTGDSSPHVDRNRMVIHKLGKTNLFTKLSTD